MKALDEVQAYYDAFAEESRLASGPSVLEFERTKEILTRVLPGPPARIVDVGGAAGAYSSWLAAQGYEVHLVDLSSRLVEEARKRIRRSRRPRRGGPAWLFSDFDARWADPALRKDMLEVARALEAEPSILGVSAHLLGLGRKP
jgi:hypothetical protein